MKISLNQVACMFCNYNEAYFDNCLPEPEFELIHSFRYFGYFRSDIEDDTTVNPTIQISDQYDYTEKQFRNILIHEMIHYYLAYTGIDTDGSHGNEFNKMARKFNKEYGMNITETINMNEYKRLKGTSAIKYALAKLF